ncbi:MAG: glycogen debranching enzyme family protein [Phycisphaerales bacterium]|nr:glycogen debranching enzyme family protein [Phycisphaerales bacterium]
MNLHLPTRICADLDRALRREWLVTNGIGGFAAGTVAGALTRRYHGLLIAALSPPLGRTLLAVKLDDTIETGGRRYPLYTNVWQTGVETPAGAQWISRFDLRSGVPTWTYEAGRARLVKRIWMEHGRNATYVQYVLEKRAAPVVLAARLLVNDRDYHSLTHGVQRDLQLHSEAERLEVFSAASGNRLVARFAGGGKRAHWKLLYSTCRGFQLSLEAARGLDHLEDHWIVGSCELPLEPDAPITFVLSTAEHADVDERGALARHEKRARGLLRTWSTSSGSRTAGAPATVSQLVLAADQFIVARPLPDEPDGRTVLAGYPWFTDWGRDTMIALPGLALVTGRHDVARQVLLTWARFVSQGIIPNRFPDAGAGPEYHTADATLWFLWAIDQYFRATRDVETLEALWPTMREIVDWHRRGTYHRIHVADDGLLYAGEPGVNLTWMDVKIGDRVVTPRIGKPIELSALWHDACWNLARLADALDQPGDEYARLAIRCRDSFHRFWNERQWCCFDVLDGPHGHEDLCRPNQVFAVSLTHSPLSRDHQLAVVRSCEQRLATWFGLRSLAPFQPHYHPRYAGGPLERDEAYHQGTAWGWLLGPYVLADFRVHKDRVRARRLLAPMLGSLYTQAIGQLAEVFDGDEPHTAAGCFAQAWSVAETLRAWHVTQGGLPHRVTEPRCEEVVASA